MIEVIELGQRDAWIEAHREGGLPGQSWHYAHALANEGLRPRLAVCRLRGARMLVPFHEREWKGHKDIATIVGLSGASMSEPSRDLLAAWREFSREQGWVTGYLHFSNGADLLAASLEPGEILNEHEVFRIDLTKPDLLGAVSFNIRQKYRYTERAGCTLVTDPEIVAQALAQHHPQAVERVRANKFYHFTAATLREWAMAPGAIALGACIGGRIVGCSLFMHSSGVGEYMVNAGDQGGRATTAWLIMKAAEEMQRRGVRSFNISGGMTHGDGLYHFKRRFNGVPVMTVSIGQIYDRERYDTLLRECGPAGGNWFPPYRAAVDTG